MFWIGTQAELQAAQKKEPIDPTNSEAKSVVLTGITDDETLPAGMPIRFAGGQSWFKGAVLEKSVKGQPLNLVVYLARPGGLYLPWYVEANRSDIKVEVAALDAAKADLAWFNEHLREVKGRISQDNAPFALKLVGGRVSKGDRVVWFGFHGLMGGEVLEDSVNSKAKVRDSRFMEESVQSVEQLFVDPESPAKHTSMISLLNIG